MIGETEVVEIYEVDRCETIDTGKELRLGQWNGRGLEFDRMIPMFTRGLRDGRCGDECVLRTMVENEESYDTKMYEQ